MAFPLAAVAGGLATSLGGSLAGSLFGGGGTEFQPSETMQALSDYGLGQLKASKAQKKSLKSQFRNLIEEGNRGGAEAFLSSYRDRFANPKFIDKALGKSYKQDVNYDTSQFFNVADRVFNQAGVGFSGEDYQNFAEQAKAFGIRSPQAFQDMLKQDLIASGKIMTPEQERLSYMFGMPSRDASGMITNMYKPLRRIDGNAIAQGVPGTF
jgi:hypothetical protein